MKQFFSSTTIAKSLSLCLTLAFFCVPFASSIREYLIGTTLFLMTFISWNLFSSDSKSYSLLRQLKLHPTLYYSLLGFCLSSLISYMLVITSDTFDKHKSAASLQYSIYILMLFYAFALSKFSLNNHTSHSRLFNAYRNGCLILIILLLSFYHLGMGGNPEHWGIRPPFGSHARVMGMAASVATLSSLVFLIMDSTQRKTLQKTIDWLGLIACSSFLIWTGSRTSMAVTYFLSFSLLAIGLVLHKLSSGKALLLGIVLILAIPATQSFPVLSWTGINRAINVSSPSHLQTPSINIEDKITSGRMTMWKKAISAIQAKPWFGYGPNGYFFCGMRYKNFFHPHNFILQFLIEWGLVGSLFLLTFLGHLVLLGLKNLPKALSNGDIDYVLAGTAVITLILTSLTDGIFFIHPSLFCIATAFAIFPLLDTNTKKKLQLLSRQPA